MKLLRKIRYKLMSENKTGRYLKYALGEIFLVMIGILLALQVNNWNESRKNRLEEQSIYNSLISSLESDLDDVIDKIAVVNKAVNAQNIFMHNAFDSIKHNFDISQIEDLLFQLSESSRSFFPNYGLYNKISNNNQIDLIQSNDLQMQIIELYEQFYKRYIDVDLNIEKQSIFSLYINFFSKIQNHATEYGRYEIDFEILRDNYDVLQDECRKINTLTVLVHGTMTTCKNEIESLLMALKEQVN